MSFQAFYYFKTYFARNILGLFGYFGRNFADENADEKKPSSFEGGPLLSAAVLVLVLGLAVLILVVVLIAVLVLVAHFFVLRKFVLTAMPLS